MILCEGGMAAIDLPDSPLTRRAFGPTGSSHGSRLPAIMKSARLTDIKVYPAFGASIGHVDHRVIDYARSVADEAVASGESSAEDAEAWVQELERSWRGTVANGSAPLVRFDLSEVTFIDATGKAFLTARHAQGAELVASGCMMRAIVAEISESAVSCGAIANDVNTARTITPNRRAAAEATDRRHF